MNKSFFTLLTCLLTVQFASAQDNCKALFAGTWKYFDTPEKHLYVVRTLEKHVEYVENGKYKDEYAVIWLSDCAYELKFISSNNPMPIVPEEGEVTKIEIYTIDAKRMKYRSTIRGMRENSEMVRIKDIVK